MSIIIVGCCRRCVRVAPPLRVCESESGGIRATLLLVQPISWTSSQGDRGSTKPEGGRGTQAESRRTDPTTSSQSPGGPHHVLQPQTLHPLLSLRHFEPDGGQLPEVRRDGSRRGEPRVPAGRLQAASGLPARYAASAAGAAAPAASSAPSSPPPSPSPPVLLLFILILLLFLSLSSSSRRAGTRWALSRAPRGAAVLRGRRWVLQRGDRERGRAAVLPGDGEGRRSRGVVQQPGAQIPHNFQIHGALRRDEHVRDGGLSRDGLHQVHGDSARGAAQEAAGSLLAGAGVRAGAALQAAEVPVRAGAGAPGRTDPPHPEPGQDLVPEPPVQTEAAGKGQEWSAAAGRRSWRRWSRRWERWKSVPLLLRVPGSIKDRKELQDRPQQRQPGRDQTEQRGGGHDGDPAAAGEPALIHGGARGFIPESASGTARADQHDADGRGANRVHKQHDRLQFTVREDLVVTPGGGLERTRT